MSWQEISILVPFEYVEPISYLFDRYGQGMTMQAEGEDRVLLRTYLPDTSSQRLARIDVGVRLARAIGDLGELIVKPLSNDEDWQTSWKEHFNLLKVGRRLVIKPSWIEHQAEPEEIVVELDPGMAFGTGYHPTTYTCLEAMEALLQPDMRVLDLGTGSGILTIAAVGLGASHVVALDTDPVAVRAARQNFRRTKIQTHVTLSQGTIPHPLTQQEPFDLIVANISARAIQDRARFILPALKPLGILVASGIINDQQELAYDAAVEAGFTSIEVCPREDWISLICRSQ